MRPIREADTRSARLIVPPLVALALWGPLAEAQSPPLEQLLERTGEYVVTYERALSALIAEEHYEQRLYRPAHARQVDIRRLRSDVLIVRAEMGGLPWLLFRDVFWVDGKELRDREARLERLFLELPSDARLQARAIADEGARFNLGAGHRNYNVPTLVLAFLHPDTQRRFRFAARGSKRMEGRRFVELEFEETSHPTVVRNNRLGQDLPAQGRVWVDPEDGTVGRTVLVLQPGNDDAQFLAELETKYRPEPSLALWVPVEMDDRWETAPRWQTRGRATSQSFKGRATYSNFRRPRVQIEEAFRVPATP